ncbi:aminotransferase class V-fold PLP-dependent enzyme [Guptibacillus hwajinpoensis]|uniref:aminotransferase class V-fold PLP-dependent enzyme n=1 Tax=Guptibacillus hwajinpoensis TaxID=208199 RepID=UPI001CD587CC|nr:aminotransferase class V-fold PLP-dependent enzyme [Pseudalkalibacillus hwajinpoensis]MCA0991986.1 aminotransferase class V-fold PLP-dependent enzyme [Pseudalkalibacillus hwajinpoensis]
MKTLVTTRIRAEFPILQKKVMLSSCSQSALSYDVITAIENYKDSLIEDGMSWELWMDKVNAAKQKFAKLINCSPHEVAVLSSVSDSISSVLHALDLKEKNVCVTEMDFPCIGQALLAQQQAQSFRITYIPEENHTIPLEHYEKFITKDTALTCIPHVSYYNGFKQDVKQIGEIAHQNGSLLMVDAYQSAGNVKIDVQEMGIDILMTGMQKYLLGVPGISFLYVKKEVAEHLQPTTTGWFGQRNPFDFKLKELEYAPSAQRFNTGTPPVINAYIAEAALSFIEKIGMEQIEQHLQKLSAYTIVKADELGFRLASPDRAIQKGSNTAIYVDAAHQIEEQMKKAKFIVSARQNVIRIAPHIYNTTEDIDACLTTLRSLT